MASKKHAELIRAWLDGAKIELWHNNSKTWRPVADPLFDEDREYRIKPAEPQRVYPEVYMTEEEVIAAWEPPYGWKGLKQFADKALRHSLDKGQVVTRAEFDLAIGDRAARDRAVADAVADYAYREGAQCLGTKQLDAIIANVK